MEDPYEEFACEFMNESSCEEFLDEEGIDLREAESLHYEDFRDI